MFGVAKNINKLLVNGMEKWKAMLYSGNSELGEAELKRGIPIVFVSIKFDFKKCEGSI